MAAIVANALVVVLEAWAISLATSVNGFPDNFVYYTQCSNLLAAIACAACLVAEVRALRGGPPLSRALRWLKYAGTCCVFMTFIVVVFILVPMIESVGQPGFILMFSENRFVTHLVGPLLVMGSYIVFEADRTMTFRQSLIGIAPTIIYAAVAYPCNIACVWDGPYPFFQVWNMPVWMSVLWFVVLVAISVATAQVPRLAARAYGRYGGRKPSDSAD